MTMNLPDFTPHGYRVLEQLNQNLQGGRVTYKAIDVSTDRPVIIKQFRFATSGDWTAYKQVEREINVLKDLHHEGIPRYQTSFDPGDGLCLVQEYKDAPDLSRTRSFSPEEIKAIAVQLLEILVYLQERIPLIVHRDIKPENILVDERLNVYLVDFGFARIGTEITALSSMVAGTTGFMPPEQLLNRTLTEASDLYGLGATLICLLTGLKSVELSNIVDHSFTINFKPLMTRYSLRFLRWLERMVDPKPGKRFPNAKEALQELKPLDIFRVPEVILEKRNLKLTSSKIGEQLTETITIKNNIPDTVLEGKWSVAPHPSDPPHTPDDHAWIHFTPREFRGNKIAIVVKVDTSKLKFDREYKREILLESNARQPGHSFTLKVRTAKPQKEVFFPPYLPLLIFALSYWLMSAELTWGWIWIQKHHIIARVMAGASAGTVLSLALPLVFWGVLAVKYYFSGYPIFGASILLFVVGCISVLTGRILWSSFETAEASQISDYLLFLGVVIGLFFMLISIIIIMIVSIKFTNNKVQDNKVVNWYFSRTVLTSVLTGIGTFAGFDLALSTALLASGLPLAKMLIYPPIKKQLLLAQYRRQESKNLIEP